METKLAELKILLVDDQESFLHLLELVLREMEIEQLASAQNFDAAIEAFQKFSPDICLLDIDLQRGAKSGIEVANVIRQEDRSIPIIFLTSHFQEDFYEQVKHVRPSSFMNKELSRLKLLQAIELASLQIDNEVLSEKVNEQKEIEQPAMPPLFKSSQLFFKVGDVYKAIDVALVDYFFAENKFTFARVSGRNFPTTVQLKVLAKELGPKFLRCHKKYLVNVDSIDSILIKDGKVKVGKELIPIGYAYRKTFLEDIYLLK